MTDNLLCGCGNVIDPDEFACSVCGSDCIDISGSGSMANPLVATPTLDPDTDNLMTCEADGLLVQLPVYISNPPRCSVTHNANQSLGSGSLTVLSFNTERYDWSVTAMHDTVTDNERITMPIDGIYVITLTVTITANATGDRAIYIKKNGNEYLGGCERKAASGSTFNHGLTCTVQEAFRAGEYVEALAKQDSGSTLNALTFRYSPNFQALFRRTLP